MESLSINNQPYITFNGSQEITLLQNNGETITYSQTCGRDFPNLIFENLQNAQLDKDPTLTNEEIFQFVKGVTTGCLTSDNTIYIANSRNQDTGMATKNAYIENFNSLIELYTNEEYSDGGQGITPEEQVELIETFLIADKWDVVEDEPESSSKGNSGFFGWFSN